MEKIKNKIIWIIIFTVLVVLTIYTIIKTNNSFSVAGFKDYFYDADRVWLFFAVICMFTYILLEGVSISYITGFFYKKIKMSKGFLYSSANIYFSAITPSAMGGQPASAYFMIKDGIPASVTAVTLILNITLYTISIIIIGLFSLVLSPETFISFDMLSKLLIILGFIIQTACISFFIMLVYKENIMLNIAKTVLNVLKKFHLIKNTEKKKEKLELQAAEYKQCANALSNNKSVIVKVLLITIIQRLAQIGATVCVYISTGGLPGNAIKVIAAQGFVILGSNAVPIPGGVGVADYLFLNGFNRIVSDKIVELELLSRGISFYSCIIICFLIIIVNVIVERIKERKVRIEE